MTAEWLSRAACRDVDPELFFPPNRHYEEAYAICSACPVRVECLEQCDADEGRMTLGYVHGMYGGETPLERVKRRRVGRRFARLAS